MREYKKLLELADKSLEEYIRESGKSFVSSEELDWGEPMGDERW